MGARFRVQPAAIEEIPEDGEPAANFAARAARDKAGEVAARLRQEPVIGADTVVEIDGELLGKPASEEQAAAMLRRLSGRVHRVHTGVALAIDGRRAELVDTAAVRFAAIDEDLIHWYVATGEPFDKAGGYAVQGIGGVLVSGIDGSPQTVIGLPLHRLPNLFAACKLDFWRYVARAR